jgi:hypothetical protein
MPLTQRYDNIKYPPRLDYFHVGNVPQSISETSVILCIFGCFGSLMGVPMQAIVAKSRRYKAGSFDLI